MHLFLNPYPEFGVDLKRYNISAALVHGVQALYSVLHQGEVQGPHGPVKEGGGQAQLAHPTTLQSTIMSVGYRCKLKHSNDFNLHSPVKEGGGQAHLAHLTTLQFTIMSVGYRCKLKHSNEFPGGQMHLAHQTALQSIIV